MKKTLILLILILFTTGCTCEYNLNIVGNNYSETVTINADNEEELSQFNVDWKIPTDEEEYNIGLKEGVTPTYQSELYDYKLLNNTLTFSHNFDSDSITKSSAVSNCYDMLTVKEYKTALIISTSTKLNCFDYYPELNRITVVIGVDKDVLSHNADYVNGGKYIWYLDKSNVDRKPINMTIDNKPKEAEETPNNKTQNKQKDKDIKDAPDYTMYIFSGILLIVMLSAYYLYNKMKNKNEMDD